MAKRDRNKALKEVTLNVYTNEPTKYKYDLLEMFYKGTYGGTIGLMEALDADTETTELLLVGIAYEDGKQVTYPLAKLLRPEEVKSYLAPDGKGGYSKDEPSA
jgi:hypothetical protein